MSYIVDGGSVSAAVIKSQTELSKLDLDDALKLTSYAWSVQTYCVRNTNGNRYIRAKFAGRKGTLGSVFKPYDVALDMQQNHLSAAVAFLNKLDSKHTEYKLCGVFSVEDGYIYTFH